MATKLYLQNSAYTPAPTGTAFGDDSRGGFAVVHLKPSPLGAGASVAIAKVGTSYDTPVAIKALSDPATVAGVLDGTISYVIGAKDSVAASTDFYVVSVGKVGTDGLVVSNGDYDLSVTGLTTTGKGYAGTVTLASAIPMAVGEQLYVEVTEFFDAPSAPGAVLTAYYGGTGSDLTAGSTAVTTNPSTFTFNSANVDALKIGGSGSVGGAAQRGMLELFR